MLLWWIIDWIGFECGDFGVLLGSRLYLKELTNRALIERQGSCNSPVFQEGDILLKINSTSTEGLSLKVRFTFNSSSITTKNPSKINSNPSKIHLNPSKIHSNRSKTNLNRLKIHSNRSKFTQIDQKPT